MLSSSNQENSHIRPLLLMRSITTASVSPPRSLPRLNPNSSRCSLSQTHQYYLACLAKILSSATPLSASVIFDGARGVRVCRLCSQLRDDGG
eukprot:6180750-Pleurochrysis_carterae.AAC.1